MEEQKKVLTVGARELDLSRLTPMTIGEREQVFKDYGIDLSRPDRLTPAHDVDFALWVLRKLDGAVTREEVAAMPSRLCTALTQYYFRLSSEVSIPQWLRPTPLVGGMGGGRETTAT
jgi:hypothetical protein